MEVHHHPDLHHKKKNFKEYFLEFVMIFLAVTLGFIAENIRENISDRGTEHADLNSLVKNLTEDSVNIESALQSYQANGMEIDSLMELIKSGEYKNNQQTLYRMAYQTRGSKVFPYTNTTFQQMENSGSLRLIRNDEIRNYIINYNNTINTDIRALESRLLETEKKQAELQNNLLNDTLYPSTEDIIYKHALKTNFFKPGDPNPVFNQSQQAQFLKLYNLLFERNIINTYYKFELGKLREMNKVLVAAIRKHYDL